MNNPFINEPNINMNDPTINQRDMIGQATIQGLNPYFASRGPDRVNPSQNAAVNTLRSSYTRIKPLRPNLLDVQAKELEKQRAIERLKSGVKWVRVLER
jgi:hypothetical protein